MNRTLAVLTGLFIACGMLAADQQPGFSNTTLTVVISVTAGAGKEWDYPEEGPAWVAGELLDYLNSDGTGDGVSFKEASGAQPNFRLDVVYTYENQGTVQITATASVAGMCRGHLFDASSGESPYTDATDAIKALADNIYSWVHSGWNYPEAAPSYSSNNYYGSSSSSSSSWFGVGFSLGRGAGLGAAYVSIQPLDFLGLEFDYGTQPCVTSGPSGQVTLWPGMYSTKLQFYGGHRSSSQMGIEVAADHAEQAGWAGHGALVFRLRPDPHFNVDLNLGMGHFFNLERDTLAYEARLFKTLGYFPTDLNLGFIGALPNYLVGGLGFCIYF